MTLNALKPIVTRLINPVARIALQLGVSPNAVTTAGAVGSSFGALFFFSREQYFLGTIFVAIFSLSDLFDGAIARLSSRGSSRWGAFLDSTLDRVTDGVICLGLILGLSKVADPLLPVVAFTLVIGALIPYIRAKAESFNIECSVGIAERTERLIIILTAIGLHGLGVSFALAIGIWVLALLGSLTVIQRLLVVRRALR